MGEPLIVNVQTRTAALVPTPSRAVGKVSIIGHTRRADTDYQGDIIQTISSLGTVNLNYEDGSSEDTIDRSVGSFIDDGVVAGDKVQVAGSASNNDGIFTITVVADQQITLNISDLTADEAATVATLIFYDQTAAVTKDVPVEYTNLSDIIAAYGADSALARSASEAMSNGANPIVCTPVEASGDEYFEGGTPGNETYSLGATEKVLTEHPTFPLLVLESGAILKEGTDTTNTHYKVDVSNKKVIFHTARPAAGQIQYKYHDVTTPGTDFDTGFTALESLVVNIQTMAYMAGNTSGLTILKNHIVSTSTGTKKRIGIIASAKDSNATTLTSLANDRIVLINHKSLKDIPSITAGVLSTLQPWQTLHRKAVVGDESDGNFTDTDYNTTFKNAQIIGLDRSEFITGNSFRFSEGTTLSPDTFLKYIDAVRVVDDVSFKVRAELSNPSLISNIKLATIPGMNTLRATLTTLMNSLVALGEIDDYTIVIPLEEIVRKPASQRTVEEQTRLNQAVSSRTFSIDVDITYSGQLHYLDPVLLSFSGV